MLRAVKVRLYPNTLQTAWFAKNFGCCRKVYNECLFFRQAAYNADGTSLSATELKNILPKLKKFYPWLREADSASLQQAVDHMDKAYQNFFEGRAGFPKFKSKHAKQSYSTPMNGNSIKVIDNAVVLPKIGKVKAAIHRRMNGIIKSATITRNHCGQYYCSVLYELPDAPTQHTIDTNNAVGLDYKSDGLYVSSDGDVCGSPKYYRLMERKLCRAERRLSKKAGFRKGEAKSHNFEKQRLRIAKIHQKIADQRNDFLHKRSLELAEKYDLVCVEDLDMKAMSNRGFGNGRATMDNGYGMFLQMLSYKLTDRGKQLIRVDKWYPSSQLCHHCGHRNPITKDLNVRIVVCPVCGKMYDRDLNAALNIKDEGVRIFLSS